MTGALVAEVLSWAFIVAGSVFVLIGGLGLIRLPDFYTRIHAAGITDTMGAWLILIGLMFSAGWTLITVKLLMLLFFHAGAVKDQHVGLLSKRDLADKVDKVI